MIGLEARPGPLTVLAQKLSFGPISLTALVTILDQSESLSQFFDLVRQYLPEHEGEIMAAPFDQRIATFHRFWEARYFALEDNGEEDYDEFLYTISIPRFGLGWDEYHEIPNMHPTVILQAALIASPYSQFEKDLKVMGMDGSGDRVPILEAAKDIIGNVVELIPAQGWTREELHKLLKDTLYEPLALFADWLYQDTGCVFWDATYEEGGEYELNWFDDETIIWLTKQWKDAETIRDRFNAFDRWLEGNPAERIKEIIAAIHKQKEIKNGQLLMDQLVMEVENAEATLPTNL